MASRRQRGRLGPAKRSASKQARLERRRSERTVLGSAREAMERVRHEAFYVAASRPRVVCERCLLEQAYVAGFMDPDTGEVFVELCSGPLGLGCGSEIAMTPEHAQIAA